MVDLKAVRALIEQGWTQAAFAKDASGGSLGYGTDPSAVCWCLIGAVEKVAGLKDALHIYPQVMDEVAGRLGLRGRGSMMDWNDEVGRTKEDVLARIDAAIELEDLKKVRDKIAAGWTQRAFSRNVLEKNTLEPAAPESVCWCLSGAAFAVAGTRSVFGPAATRLAETLGFETQGDMQRWNDATGRTQAEVLARIDAAIAAKAPA